MIYPGAQKEDLLTKVVDYTTQSTSNNEGTLREIQNLLAYVSVNYAKEYKTLITDELKTAKQILSTSDDISSELAELKKKLSAVITQEEKPKNPDL